MLLDFSETISCPCRSISLGTAFPASYLDKIRCVQPFFVWYRVSPLPALTIVQILSWRAMLDRIFECKQVICYPNPFVFIYRRAEKNSAGLSYGHFYYIECQHPGIFILKHPGILVIRFKWADQRFFFSLIAEKSLAAIVSPIKPLSSRLYLSLVSFYCCR
jgi:hypothetical protein